MSVATLLPLPLLAVLALAACPGEVGRPKPHDGSNAVGDGPSKPGADQGTRFDGPAVATDGPVAADGAAPMCSAQGTKASCDPVGQTGCGANAACYIVNGVGSACVCPPGGGAEGSACNTTSDCAAGLGCAGNQPPGACRRFCAPPPAADSCGQRTCTPTTPFPQYGLCI